MDRSIKIVLKIRIMFQAMPQAVQTTEGTGAAPNTMCGHNGKKH
jgi:hypothetical protein